MVAVVFGVFVQLPSTTYFSFDLIDTTYTT